MKISCLQVFHGLFMKLLEPSPWEPMDCNVVSILMPPPFFLFSAWAAIAISHHLECKWQMAAESNSFATWNKELGTFSIYIHVNANFHFPAQSSKWNLSFLKIWFFKKNNYAFLLSAVSLDSLHGPSDCSSTCPGKNLIGEPCDLPDVTSEWFNTPRARLYVKSSCSFFSRLVDGL